MIDDNERNADCQKSLTGGGNCSSLGQRPRKPCHINKQTFQNNKTFSFKKALKLCQKLTAFGAILNRLSSLSSFFDKLRNNNALQNFPKKFKRVSSGYVLILFIAVLPILLFGAKMVLDNQSLLNRKAMGTEYLKKSSLSSERFVKQCAQEAALAVAQKWNPALTYDQQRESMLRIADDIYNKAATYVDSTVIRAIHGIDIPKESQTKGKTYEPIKITKLSETRLSPSLKQIGRTTKSTNMNRYYINRAYSDLNTSCLYYYAPAACRHFSAMQSILIDDDWQYFRGDDIFDNFNYAYYCSSSTSPMTAVWRYYATIPAVVGADNSASNQVTTKSYTTRKNLDDNTVKIECENDKIKVTTDDDIGYAVPAESKVDIILAVPTNSAASNQHNYDKNTTTLGTPYISTKTTPTTDAQSTPIYQITRAYQIFLKKFFYTRGVNVGVIPYSGNLSVKSNRSAWVKAPNSFVSTYFLDGSYEPMIVGAMMYGTANTDLTSLGTYGGKDLAYGLLCRGTTSYYNGNTLTLGDLLSTTDPSNYQFRKMIYNPCYAGHANLLSMKCEKNNIRYWMNPYYVLEMNSDVQFIYGMLGAFYPYYDDRNVSNFIFIPITWANNLLQSWSTTGSNSAVNTSSTNLGRLSTPSKTTSGRKKALILVVNKPDWFEPGEMTYLGFDNDFSEIPMTESDCIRGDIDYSDTNQKFADGSSYDGTIQGAKKILKLEKVSGDDLTRTNGFYECGQGKYRLKFPQKGLIKLVVAPATGATSGDSGTVTFYGDNEISDNVGTHTVNGMRTFTFSGGQAPSEKYTNCSSTRGVNFGHNLSLYKVRYSCENCYISSATLTDQWIRDYIGQYGRYLPDYKPLILSDGTLGVKNSNNDHYSVFSTFYNVEGQFEIGSDEFNQIISYLPKFRDPCYSVWNIQKLQNTDSAGTEYQNSSGTGQDYLCIPYGAEGICQFCVVGNEKRTWVYQSFDNSEVGSSLSQSIWSNYDVHLSLNGVITFMRGVYLLQHYTKNGVSKTLQSLIEYPRLSDVPGTGLTRNEGIYLVKLQNNLSNKIVAGNYICFNGDGDLSVTVTTVSKIKFVGVVGDTSDHELSGETTYVITPDKISNGSDGAYYIDLELTNIKLISAEISNRTCSSIVKPIAATYVDNVKSTTSSETRTDSITFSSSTSGSNGLISYSTQSGTVSAVSGGRECTGTAKGRLTFPYKGTVKLTVTKGSAFNDDDIGGTVSSTFSMDGYTWRWHYFSQALNNEGTSTDSWTYTESSRGFAAAYGNSRFVIMSKTGYTAYSSDGVTWTRGSTVSPPSSSWNAMAWNGSYFVALTGNYGYTTYSSDGNSWSTPTQALSGVYTSYLDDDLGWNGSYFFAKGDDSNMYMTSSLKGTSGWYNNGSVSSLGDGEQWKYGGGYYARFYPQNTSFRYGSSVMSVNNTYTLPLAPRALNYGPGYWLIMTSYGALMKSSSACPDSWSIVDGGSSSSVLNSLSGRTNWVGICYGGGRWVAYTYTGDVAVLTKKGTSNTIKFSNTSTYTSSQTVSSQTTYTFTSSQISDTQTSDKYYIDFDMTNIKLVSAHIECSVPTTILSTGFSVTKTVADVIDFTNGNRTSKNTLTGSSTHVLTTTISGSSVNGLYKVSAQTATTISSAVRGNLKLTLYPVNSDAAIRLRKGSSDTTGQYQKITGRTVIDVPDEYLLPDSSDSTGNKCILTLNLNRVYILNVTLTNWKPRFNNPPLPARSRYIDYSTNPLNFLQTSTNSNFYEHWAYDTVNGYWSNTTNKGYWAVLNIEDIHGDFSTLGYSDEIYEAWLLRADGLRSDVSDYGPANVVTTAGLNRYFVEWENRPNTVEKGGFMWTRYGNDKPRTLYNIMGTMTLPINAALYFGASGSTQHAYQWQSDAEGNITTYSATEGVKKVTQDACAKLKSDWGSHLRVYLIKYRKQTQYKHPITQEAVNFDYSYLDNCATATSAPYMYDITNQSELNSALSAIYTNIKDWAGYQNAKNVD